MICIQCNWFLSLKLVQLLTSIISTRRRESSMRWLQITLLWLDFLVSIHAFCWCGSDVENRNGISKENTSCAIFERNCTSGVVNFCRISDFYRIAYHKIGTCQFFCDSWLKLKINVHIRYGLRFYLCARPSAMVLPLSCINVLLSSCFNTDMVPRSVFSRGHASLDECT